MPIGVRLDDTIYASHLNGADPVTGQLAQNFATQTDQALANLSELMKRAGGTLDNVARVAAFVTRLEDRESFAQQWEAFFAPPRPACKVLVERLPGGEQVSLQVLALLGGTRQRIDVPGVPARDPTVKIGNWVFSSRVHGTDPATSELPDGEVEQAKLAFNNIRQLVELAGGTTANITQLTVFLRDLDKAELVHREIESLFPEQLTRPRVHLLTAFIPPKIHVMVEMMAAL